MVGKNGKNPDSNEVFSQSPTPAELGA